MSANGAITWQPVFCLGWCAAGPSILLGGRPVGRLNPEPVDRPLKTFP